MAFNTVEIFVLVFVLLVILKLFLVSFSSKRWFSLVKKLYSNSNLLVVVELILAVIIIYFLLDSMTVVEIIAGALVGALLTGMTFAVHSKEIIPIFEKMSKGKILKRAWIPIIAWLILSLWALFEIVK